MIEQAQGEVKYIDGAKRAVVLASGKDGVQFAILICDAPEAIKVGSMVVISRQGRRAWDWRVIRVINAD